MSEEYKVIIIGGGPAGLAAGLYTSRARLPGLLLERGMFGGIIVNSELVENYPGFPQGISGAELGQLFYEQASKFGLNTVTADATSLELNGEQKVVTTSEGKFSARTVIIATGSERRKLDVRGEQEFAGKGVSYCATCDAAFFEGVPVAVVGGGDAAITEALHLTHFASKVILIHRRDQLRASRIMQEKVFAEPKMQLLWNTVVDEIQGGDLVQRLMLRNVKTGEKFALDVAGVFVSVGLKPNAEFLGGLLPMDEGGHIITNERMETKISGVYAVGDVRHDSARQVVTAAGDGVTAAIFAEKYISGI